MKTIRVRLANTVLVCAAAGLAFAGSLAGNAQSDDRGYSARSAGNEVVAVATDTEVAAARESTVTRKLQAMFARHQQAIEQSASADVNDEPIIQQVANEVEQKLTPEPNPNVVRQSDILQHLQELYEKDGRAMPPMTLDQAPNTSGSAPAPAVNPVMNATQQPAANAGQHQPETTAETAKKRPNLLRRLFNRPSRGESAAAKKVTKGREEAPKSRTRSTKSASRNMKAEAHPAAPQQGATHPRLLENVNGASETPQVQQTTTIDELGKVRLATPADGAEQDQQNWKPAASPADRAGIENPLVLDGSQSQHERESLPPATIDALAPAQRLAGDPVESAASQETSGEEESNAPQTNPFTGLKLTDDAPVAGDAPATARVDSKNENTGTDEFTPWAMPDTKTSNTGNVERAPNAAELPANADAPTQPADQGTEAKLHRIVERSGKPGMKGFCVVALRDDRDLLDSQPEFQVTFEGKSYFFSTAMAKAKFQQNPRKYVPVAGGADVVVLAHNNQSVPGTLEHALWFRERLYLFSSDDSRQTFMNNPQQYLDAASNAVAE